MSFTPIPNPLPVSLGVEYLAPFGDLIANELTPSIQLDFVYGINTQTGVSTTANGASVDTDAARLRLQTSTATNGSAIFQSRRPCRYRPGQGIVARFTPLFTIGVADSTQIMGAGSGANGYFFGFNGATFGICHRINSSDTWIPQSTWNGDKCDGTGASGFNWDKTDGNVCQIKYPYLGYGNITFWVQNQATSTWILCHTIRYTNTTNAVQLRNPSLFFYAQAINSGNASNLTMYSGSVGFFLAGKRDFPTSPRWAIDNNKSGITTEANILSIRNATTYNGITNTSLIRLTQISFASSAASGVSTLRIKINATLGGSPSYTTINGTTADGGVTITNGNSVSSYDTAGTTVTGGTYIFNASTGNGGGGAVIDLTPYSLFIAAGETATISVSSTISSAAAVSVNWIEDI
jgi:hypothetical protein